MQNDFLSKLKLSHSLVINKPKISEFATLQAYLKTLV